MLWSRSAQNSLSVNNVVAHMSMKKTASVLALACHAMFALAGCTQPDASSLPRTRPLTDRVFERTPARIERGKYLAGSVCQCFLCHTERDSAKPGAPPIAERIGSGRIISEDSARRIVAPNLTPDPETGAGTWTDDMLARAIREGIGHDGRALAGPMWYWSFSNLSDEDLASVVVYLRTLPPVRNPLPKRRLSPAGEQEALAGPTPITEPVPVRTMADPVERGRYLADIADCSGCHSAWEAPYIPGVFGGGNLLEARGRRLDHDLFSANITSDPSGIAYYDDSLFIETIRTGIVRARRLDLVMPWVVFRNMNDEDLRALYAYLAAMLPVRHVVDNTVAPSPCPMCGQEHGEGEYNVSKFETFPHLEIDSSILDQYAGKYEGEIYAGTIRRDGSRLLFELDGKSIELTPGADSLFYARELPGPIRFVRDQRGRVDELVSLEDKEYVAKKIE